MFFVRKSLILLLLLLLKIFLMMQRVFVFGKGRSDGNKSMKALVRQFFTLKLFMIAQLQPYGQVDVTILLCDGMPLLPGPFSCGHSMSSSSCLLLPNIA